MKSVALTKIVFTVGLMLSGASLSGCAGVEGASGWSDEFRENWTSGCISSVVATGSKRADATSACQCLQEFAESDFTEAEIKELTFAEAQEYGAQHTDECM